MALRILGVIGIIIAMVPIMATVIPLLEGHPFRDRDAQTLIINALSLIAFAVMAIVPRSKDKS